jgi:hypothetical protein
MATATVTKLVSNRSGNTRAVVSALTVHVKKRVPKLETILFLGRIARGLTVEELIAHLAAVLTDVTDRMNRAEEALVLEQSDDAPARAARDLAVAELRDAVDGVGRALRGAYPEEEVARFDLVEPVPRAPELLVTRAGSVHAALLAVRPDVPMRRGCAVDFDELASELEQSIRAATRALDTVKVEEREEHDAIGARNAIIAEFESRYDGIGKIAAGLLELVGEPEVAARVMPTVRRRAGLEGPAEDPTDPTTPGGGELDPTGPGGPFEPVP